MACMMTREFTPLEPDVVEQKFYARGVGQIQAAADLRWLES